jgi:integrase
MLNRDNLVKYVLKPILKSLGIPAHETGLHAFRHGLATELANASVPLPVLQQQMRHADVRTTLRIYSHLVSETHRECMEKIGKRPIGTNVPISTEVNA